MDKENFGLQITDEDIEWVRTIMPDIELDEWQNSNFEKYEFSGYSCLSRKWKNDHFGSKVGNIIP